MGNGWVGNLAQNHTVFHKNKKKTRSFFWGLLKKSKIRFKKIVRNFWEKILFYFPLFHRNFLAATSMDREKPESYRAFFAIS